MVIAANCHDMRAEYLFYEKFQDLVKKNYSKAPFWTIIILQGSSDAAKVTPLRRGMLMVMLQQSANTMPLWIGWLLLYFSL